MKKIYIVPGYKHTLETSGYRELMSSLENIGYSVEFIGVTWKRRVMSDFIIEAETQIQPTENTIILGFSFGAMIALKLSEKYKFLTVILCSLSPYFAEDLHLLPPSYKENLGVRRWKDFEENYSEVNIPNAQKNDYVCIYGSEESERLKNRNQKMIGILGVQEIYIVENIGHDIADNNYRKTIISSLT